MRGKRLLIVSLLFVVVFSATSVMAGGILVSADWLKAHLDDPNIRIIDVQNKPDSYDKGHIPNAVKVIRHVDLEDYTKYPPNKYPGMEQFIDLMERLGIDNNTTVVAYDDHHGIFASRMIFVMELYGHDVSKLKILDGGIKQWKKKGYPVTTKPFHFKQKKPYMTKGPNLNLLVSWQDVFRDVVQKQRPDVVLHDARPVAEYIGENIRAIRGGHIPGAINVTGVDAANYKESQLYKPADEIKKAFTSAGITPDKTVYTYCHSSDRAAHAYVVLKHILGYPDVKIYEGAWKEWAALTALPAEDEVWVK